MKKFSLIIKSLQIKFTKTGGIQNNISVNNTQSDS